MRQLRAIAVLVAILAALTALPGLAGVAPAIAITPDSGPPEIDFVAALTGFVPGEKVALRLAAATVPREPLVVPAVTITAEGTYTLSINALLLPQGTYTLTAMIGTTIVASASFTVLPPGSPVPSPPATGSGGYLPGLPNTGGGSVGVPPIRALLLLFGALGLFAVVAAAIRRRPTTLPARRTVPIDDGVDQSGR